MKLSFKNCILVHKSQIFLTTKTGSELRNIVIFKALRLIDMTENFVIFTCKIAVAMYK